jgi:hypothetical protein
MLRHAIVSLAQRSGPADRQYFSGGVWHSTDESYWFCDVGPGSAAAALWRTTGRRDGWLHGIALQTFDRAIADHRNDDGSFGVRDESPDIVTMTFGIELGATYLNLLPSLAPARRAQWRSALAGAADFLIRNGNLAWYTNGNVNLGNAELFYLVWRATGESRFKRAYDEALTFTLHPPQSRWQGFGLQLLPAHASGGQAGYLAESGGAQPGFDPEYTELQLDIASRLFLLSGDTRVRRLGNLLVNALLPRVDPGKWLLDTSGGTRHPQTGRSVPLLTPGLAVMGWVGGRHELATKAVSQLDVVRTTYEGQLGDYSPYLYRGLANEVSVILLAASRASRPRA